ncbi:MAG: archease [Rhodothermia bacterium]|nr:archease [Rhodothermia bacterium]
MSDFPWLREIDHTADVGIEVRAPTEKLLFERAAIGMFTILVSADSVGLDVEKRVSIEAQDRDALLVRWLSELNYLHQVEHLVLRAFEIESIDAHHLIARVSGETYDPERHTIECEIKAVTFHDLKIVHDRNEWSVQIIFDM